MIPYVHKSAVLVAVQAQRDAELALAANKAVLESDRRSFAAALTERDQRIVALQASSERELVRAEARYAELMALHRAVTVPAVPALLPSAEIEREISADVTKIIREQSETNGRTDYALARHLRTYAKTLKREGKSHDEIIGALVQWQTFNGEAS